MAVQHQDKELDKMYLIGTGVPNFQKTPSHETTPSHDTGDDPCKFALGKWIIIPIPSSFDIWVCLKIGYIPNEIAIESIIAIFHRDNDH